MKICRSCLIMFVMLKVSIIEFHHLTPNQSAKMVLTLYMQEFSPSVRSVLFTATALDLNLEKKIVDLSKKENLTVEYLKLNPQHTIPTLVDDGHVIWDSHAINAYLVDRYGKDDSLYPKDLIRRALVDQRLHFDSQVIFSWLRFISRSVKYKGLRRLTNDQKEALDEGLGLLDTFLKDSKWVAGNSLTIADFSLIANITTIEIFYPVDREKYPNVCKWLHQAESLPFYHLNRKGIEDFRKVLSVLVE